MTMADTVIWCFICFVFGMLVGMGSCAWWVLRQIWKNGRK